MTNVLSFSIKRATAMVSMNHIWIWSRLASILAVSAGVILDTIILAILFLIKSYHYEGSYVTIFSFVMFIKIFWQFRFHRNSDGRLLLKIILDNPLIEIDYKFNKDVLSRRDRYVWQCFMMIGYCVELFLFVYVISIGIMSVQ